MMIDPISKAALLELRSLLEDLGYHRRLRSHAATADDPWTSLHIARRMGHDFSRASTLFQFFLCGIGIPFKRLENATGSRLLCGLGRMGFIRSVADRLFCNYSILSMFGCYLIVERPVEGSNNRVTSRHTYLSSSTYALAFSLLQNRPTGRVLELGCGTGLLSMLASRYADSVIAADIDSTALQLATFNAVMNQCAVETVHSNMFDRLSGPFDHMLFNPPWRIIPPGVEYPNPIARVGRGTDGLAMLRRFLSRTPNVLRPEGSAVLTVEFPGDARGFQFQNDLEEFTSIGRCSLEVQLCPDISVEEQSWTSAEICLPWNSGCPLQSLYERFVAHYSQLGYESLYPAICSIRNDLAAMLTVGQAGDENRVRKAA